MCGIAGILELRGRPVDQHHLQWMTDSQAHRGPDGAGIWVDGSVGLGHRRLAIIDLSDAGAQPMKTADESLTLTYNGEIYNYIELRHELHRLGYSFQTATDTEVLLAAYQTWGAECVHRLRGMWAFAIWDSRNRELFCSRDPFGIKPFFYRHSGEAFHFASDIRALLTADSHAPNWAFLIRQLSDRRFERYDETSFDGIVALPPATNLTLQNGRLTLTRYWMPDLEAVRRDHRGTPPEEGFRTLLTDSIRLHFRSDVPVGICLSGGLDSSSLVALSPNGDPLRTFSVDYPGTSSSESRYFRQVAERFGTQQTEFSPDGAVDYLVTLQRMIAASGEPDQGIGVYSQWKVIELAAAHVTVLLDGQGADEMLGGYPFLVKAFLADLLRRGKLIRGLREFRAYRSVAPGNFGRSVLRESLGFNHRVGLRESQSDLGRLKRLFRPATERGLLSVGAIEAAVLDEHNPIVEPPGIEDGLTRAQWNTLSRGLLPSLLLFEDRISMAFSVESRVPFLDRPLVEYCLALSADQRFSKGYTKAVLRRAMDGRLPPDVLWRREKKGFPTPFAAWLQGGLGKAVRDLLLNGQTGARQLIDQSLVETMLNSQLAGQADHSVEIFNLVSLEIWLRQFVDDCPEWTGYSARTHNPNVVAETSAG
ncbi:MAG: asparagine synthase (glutamine-hydrolyzing) [Gemmatimonadota bacterium]